MKWIYIIATLYLASLGIIALFANLSKLPWFFKLVLGLLAGVSIILSLCYQQIEKRVEEIERKYFEARTDEQMRMTLQGLEDLKEKEKKGLLKDSDYTLYIVRYLESIDHTLKFKGGKDTREWLTTYYEAVERIPSYFNPQEWRESEKLIYESMVNEIGGHFNMRGTFGSGMHKELLEIFKNERVRLIQAKEREFNK